MQSNYFIYLNVEYSMEQFSHEKNWWKYHKICPDLKNKTKKIQWAERVDSVQLFWVDSTGEPSQTNWLVE